MHGDATISVGRNESQTREAPQGFEAGQVQKSRQTAPQGESED
jgi:hypothetical protein